MSDVFARNQGWSKHGPYATELAPDQESKFKNWLSENKVPYDPTNTRDNDYDMRGFYQALMSGDSRATQALNPNDHTMHFPDVWKTPYHESFSNESIYSTPGAPRWNEKDQLVLPNGTVVFDERNRASQQLQKGAP